MKLAPEPLPSEAEKAQRALHERTRLAFHAAVLDGIDGQFYVREQEGLLVALTTADGLAFLNRVTVTRRSCVAQVPAVLAEFRLAGIGDLVVIAPDESAYASKLEGLGLRASDSQPVALLRTDSVGPRRDSTNDRDLLITAAQTPEERELFLRVLCAGYDADHTVTRFIRAEHSSPSIHAFLAWSGGEPIAAAAMSWHGSGVVLGGASTLDAHRGLGAQTALLRARLDRAAPGGLHGSDGGSIVVATAAPRSASLRNLERMGFTVQRRRAWQPITPRVS